MRVAVASSSALFRDGLASLLGGRGLVVTTAASDDASLVEGVTEEAPDVVVLDARMPPTFTDEGIRTAPELRARRPGMPVLVLAADAVTSRAATLLDLDARGMGYLARDPVDGVGSLLDALE